MKTAKLEKTKDYDLFEMHPCNRPLHENKVLERSMRVNGFMPSSPLQCVRNGNGKLKILRGHHRFSLAKKLGIPVYYIIDESNTDIFDLEGASTTAWNAPDFAAARARSGDKNMRFLLDFKERHGLTLGAAASLVGGQSAGSGNKVREIKSGTFNIGDMGHAKDVVRVTDKLRELGVAFATTTAFVAAVSKVLRVPEINHASLMHKVGLHYHLISKRGTAREYIQEIEELYNYGVKTKRLPLAFRAEEEGRKRSVINTNRKG
jgi:hypothetical protein